MIIQKR